MLVCEKCGSQYFIEHETGKFNDMTMGAGAGYRVIGEKWKFYECLNKDCSEIIIPNLTSMSVPKADLRIQEEIISTRGGDPKEIPDDDPRRMPLPGEIRMR